MTNREYKVEQDNSNPPSFYAYVRTFQNTWEQVGTGYGSKEQAVDAIKREDAMVERNYRVVVLRGMLSDIVKELARG